VTISRDDLEAKLREIEGVVTDTEEDAKQNMGMVIGGAVVIVIAVVAFGIWRSRRRRIHIEVYRTT
jgi:FtsZ-interacting cell division protein ZipA